LIALVDDLVAIEKNPVDRLKRVLSQFFSAVTLDIPRAVRVAQWKAILGSPIGQRVVDLIKSVVPNGVPASESAGVEICTLFSLEQLTFPSQGIQPYFSDFSEKDELYLSDLRGVFRDLIRMGCKQTWIGEALLMSYGTDRDFSQNAKLEHQFMTDFKFIKSKSVDTLLGVTIGYCLLGSHVVNTYRESEILALEDCRPFANQAHLTGQLGDKALNEIKQERLALRHIKATKFLCLAATYFHYHKFDTTIQFCKRSLAENAKAGPTPILPYQLLAASYFAKDDLISALGIFHLFPFVLVDPDLAWVDHSLMNKVSDYVRRSLGNQSVDSELGVMNFRPTPKNAYHWTAFDVRVGDQTITVTNALLAERLAPPLREVPPLEAPQTPPVMDDVVPYSRVLQRPVSDHLEPKPHLKVKTRGHGDGRAVDDHAVVVAEVPDAQLDQSIPIYREFAFENLRNIRPRELAKWVADSPVFDRYEAGGRHPIAVLNGPGGELRIPLVNPHARSVPIGTLRSIVTSLQGVEATVLPKVKKS